MKTQACLAGVLAAALLAAPAAAEPLIWGFQGERFEYRLGEGGAEALAWDFDAMAGSDELMFVWRSEGEYALEEDAFEELENQARLETPVSAFWNAAAGLALSTPEGADRLYGVVGLHGLAPQWAEVDADLFVSDKPFARLDADYELLITNWITLIPTLEVELPLTDDEALGRGGFGPELELGLRLHYDVKDRLLSPYVGVHYERAFGETAARLGAEGEATEGVFAVIGLRTLF